MFAKLARLFRGATAGSSTPRGLDRVEDLQAGDLVQFALLDLPELSGQRLEVTAVNTYRYGGGPEEHEWQLTGPAGEVLYLAVEADDERWLAVSRKLSRAEVAGLFDLDAFAGVFDGPGNIELRRNAGVAALAAWTVDAYHQVASAQRGEFRSGRGGVERFDYYALESADERFFVDAEVYADGETEVAAGCYLPPRAIEQLWPRAGGRGSR
ncbi:hypothetical protein [Arhodomonas sp. AD133]|uniref:hypothetical protein n=1 Tax=Arhodomonas sp. AD133 TaxID=3415009 RepID=UPI003EB6C6C7